MLRRIHGRVWMVGDGVTTEAMCPSFAVRLPISEAAKHVFQELRPGWAQQVRPGDIVVAGSGFGSGASRPTTALFRQLGVAALVAEEFTSPFLRDCINHGLPALAVPGVRAAFSDGDTARLDLARGQIENTTTGSRLTGGALPPLVLGILAAGGIFPKLACEGYLPNPGAPAHTATSPRTASGGVRSQQVAGSR